MVLVIVIVRPSEVVVSVSTNVSVSPPNVATICGMLLLVGVGCGGGV